MNVEQVLKKAQATVDDIIIIRDNGKEYRCLNCGPYVDLVKTKYGKKVQEYWRENNSIIIILKTR